MMMKAKSKITGAYNTLRLHPRIVTAFFFAVMLFCGLFFAKDYGMGWDDVNEQGILDSNTKSYARLFFGEDSDEYRAFKNTVSISESVERDHGTAAYYPFTLVAYLITGTAPRGFRTFYIIKHMYTFLIFAGGLFCMYLTAKKLTKRHIPAYFCTALLFFSPRFFAESTFNTKDIILASFVMMTLWFTFRLCETGKHRYAAGFAVCCAFAANTRIIGFWLAALSGIVYFAGMLRTKEWRKYLPAAATAVLGFCTVYYLITPAAWSNPVAQLGYTIENSSDFSRWLGRILYNGEIYSPVNNPLPWHYIPVMLALTMPPVTVLLIVWGVVSACGSIVRKRENAAFYGVLLAFVFVPLIFGMIKGSNLYNSWRHFYFIIGPLMLLAAQGMNVLLSGERKVWLRRSAAGIITAQLGVSCALITISHPYEYGYLNLFAGSDAHERYELDYWNVSAMNALEALADKEYNGTPLCVMTFDYNSEDGLVKGYRMLSDEYRKKIRLMDSSVKGGSIYYLVNETYYRIRELNTKQSLGYEIEEYSDYGATMDEVVTVECLGNKMMSIYSKK